MRTANALNLFYEFADRRLDCEISEMQIRDGKGELLGSGKGKLVTEDDSGNIEFRISIDFDPKELMSRSAGGRPFAYHTDGQKLVAVGTLTSGISFETSPMDIGTISFGGDQVLQPDWVRLLADQVSNKQFRLVLTTLKKNFLPPNVNLDVSEALRENLPFPYGQISLESAIYETRGREDDEYLLAKSWPGTEDDINAEEHALLLALSFCSGKKIHGRGSFQNESRAILTLRKTSNTRTSTVFEPLHFVGDESGYGMIAKLQAFFRKPENKPIEDLLEVFLYSPSPVEPGARALIVCVILEGLLAELIERITLPVFPEFEDSKQALIDAIEVGGISGLDPKFKDRFKGRIVSMTAMSLRDQLQFLAKHFGVPIEVSELIFLKLRSRLAHGTFRNPYSPSIDEAQSDLDNLGYVTNLFNKFILRIAGYDGKYFDYSIPGGIHSVFSDQLPTVGPNP